MANDEGCPAQRPWSQRGSRQELTGSQGPRLRRGGEGSNETGQGRHTGAVDANKVWRQRKAQLKKIIKSTNRFFFFFLKKGAQRSPDTFFFWSSQHGCKVHMDLVDLYLPECFTFHSDTE